MGEPTSEESLRQLLARVHERLNQPGSVDAESRKILGSLVRDIDRALGEGEGAPPARTHVPRLESMAVRFQTDHPGLAELLRQVVDALGKAGI